MNEQPGGRFQILVDGKLRSYAYRKESRDRIREYLKNRNPPSEVAVKDRRKGGLTVVAYKPGK